MRNEIKTVVIAVVAAVVSQCALGRCIALDLSGGKPAALKRAVGSVAGKGSSSSLRTTRLAAGSADVGEVAVGDVLSVKLFDDVSISLELAKKMPTSICGDAFIARPQDGGLNNAVVMRTKGGLVMDVLDSRRKRVYKVLSTQSEVKVQELDAEGGGSRRCGAMTPPRPAARVSYKMDGGSTAAFGNSIVAEGGADIFIDVLVVYDGAAAEWAEENGGGMATFAELAVQKMNLALVNSGLGDVFQFRYMGSSCIPARSDDLAFVLEAVTFDVDGGEAWKQVRTLRDKVGADIVTVLVDTGSDHGFVGYGWSLEAEEGKDPDRLNIGLYKEYGFNVSAVRSVELSHTMTHETGHNMGAGHSEFQDADPGPQLYGYSKAYYFSVDEDKYHTIMAYDREGPGGVEVPYFSSPEVTPSDFGVPVGDATHDNARTLARTCDAISKWGRLTGADIDDDWDPTTIRIDTEERYETESDGSFPLSLRSIVLSATDPNVTVKGLPAGLKYDAKTMTFTGKATKPGVCKVTVSATNATVKKAVTATFDLVVPNLSSEVLPGLERGTEAYGIVTCGVAFDPTLVDCKPENGWTVKVSGLPAGLKFTAKDIMKKGSKTEVEIPENTIYGVPTKAGTFTVTFTATKGKEKQTATITLTTEALPPWAQGTFTGYVRRYGGEPDYEDDYGLATMTVGANGKVSGKVSLCGTNWTFAAASYTASDGGDYFEVSAEAKAGKSTKPLWIQVSRACGGELLDAVAEGWLDGCSAAPVSMWRNVWKDKATAAAAKAEAARWEGVYTLSMDDGGYLSLTVGRDGNVKASGKLADGTGVSATSPLVCDSGAGWFAYFYAAPGAYKGGAFAASVGIEEPRGALCNCLGVAQWSSRNPQATGEYGEGFVRPVSFVGAYYDKAEKLNAHYESLRFETEAPQLAYTFKRTYKDEKGKKVTESEALEAAAAGTLGQEGLTATLNEKGAFVVAKATKPVQDKKTKEWSYNGTNDGALTLSFAQATGIFKGSYTFWYDYESAFDETKPDGRQETWAHASKKVSFEGIWVQGAEALRGFYLWDATGSYNDPKTGKLKTYKYKESHSVGLSKEQ